MMDTNKQAQAARYREEVSQHCNRVDVNIWTAKASKHENGKEKVIRGNNENYLKNDREGQHQPVCVKRESGPFSQTKRENEKPVGLPSISRLRFPFNPSLYFFPADLICKGIAIHLLRLRSTREGHRPGRETQRKA